MTNHSVQDREHLRTLDTKVLRDLRRRVSRSIDELQAYHSDIDAVLLERSEQEQS